MRAVIYAGDCLEILPGLADEFVDAVVTDPPYELGFMGRAWDASGIAYNVDLWKQCFRVLKPGGHLLAFGGTRTSHRLTCAIEDAGFEIRDEIAWLYGSGFPKSLDVSKAIDKAGGNPLSFRLFARAYSVAIESSTLTHADIDRHLGIKSSSCYWARADHRGGLPPRHHWDQVRDLLALDAALGHLYDAAEREVIGERATGLGTGRGAVAFIGDSDNRDVTAPATDDAKCWAGWGTALKPAHEPIVVARKPLIGTIAANVLAHGTGALNIDACRVEGVKRSPDFRGTLGQTESRDTMAGGPMARVNPAESAGRWPTNVVLDEVAAAELDEQSGISTSQGGSRGMGAKGYAGGALGAQPDVKAYGDTGGASRFFPVFRYQAKAPTRERPKVDGVAHPTVKPLELMRWLVRLVTPADGIVLEPFAGSGTTIEAAVLEGMRCIGIEREESYGPLIAERMARAGLVAL